MGLECVVSEICENLRCASRTGLASHQLEVVMAYISGWATTYHSFCCITSSLYYCPKKVLLS